MGRTCGEPSEIKETPGSPDEYYALWMRDGVQREPELLEDGALLGTQDRVLAPVVVDVEQGGLLDGPPAHAASWACIATQARGRGTGHGAGTRGEPCEYVAEHTVRGCTRAPTRKHRAPRRHAEWLCMVRVRVWRCGPVSIVVTLVACVHPCMAHVRTRTRLAARSLSAAQLDGVPEVCELHCEALGLDGHTGAWSRTRARARTHTHTHMQMHTRAREHARTHARTHTQRVCKPTRTC